MSGEPRGGGHPVLGPQHWGCGGEPGLGEVPVVPPATYFAPVAEKARSREIAPVSQT